MGQIYRSAAKVLIWLGEETPSDGEAVRTINEMHLFFKRYVPGQQGSGNESLYEVGKKSDLRLPDLESTAWVSICELFWRRWFSRAWIIQEVAWAKDAMLYCGSLTIQWDVLAELTEQLTKHGLAFGLRSTMHGGRASPLSVQYIDWIKTKVIAGKKKMDLVDTLVFSRCFQVTDGRDRVYSLLSFVKDEQQIKPDYTVDVADLYSTIVANAITSSCSLRLLEHVQGVPAESNSGVPSWVGLWGLRRKPLSELSANLSAGISKDLCFRITPDRKSLIVRGILVDELQDLVPQSSNFQMDGRYSYKGSRLKISWDILGWVNAIEYAVKNGSESTYFISDMEEIVARVLALDSVSREQKAQCITYGPLYRDWKTFHRMLMQHFAQGTLQLTKQLLSYESKVQQYDAAVVEAASCREFCRTRDGRLGLVPIMCQPGDLVCVFHGCNTPYVLRRRDKESYHFIGECYIDGLMDGQAFATLPQSTGKKFWQRKKTNTNNPRSEMIVLL